jgi:hypothetical protein
MESNPAFEGSKSRRLAKREGTRYKETGEFKWQI